MNTLKNITTMPSTRGQIQLFVESVREEILSGDYNVIDIEVQLKAMEELIKAIRSDSEIRAYVLDEASKYEKTFETLNAKVTIRNATTYDYSVDAEWSGLKKEETMIANQRKARELILKGVKDDYTDTRTGEVITVIPSTSKETISITLK